MKNANKFYWIKLRTDFFSREDIDFLLSQKNGAEYVVLYQMLCLNTANNGGRLETKIGEVITPYNAEKIVRDCKYFDIDTVNVAMTLYKKLCLVYEEGEDGVLRISNYDEMVGSETAWAEKKRLYRKNQKALEHKDNVEDFKEDIVRQEYRDKRLDIRDKSIENRDKNTEISSNENIKNISCCKAKKFIKPTVDEIKQYCEEKNYNNINAEYFYDYYESKGWVVGKTPMKDWKATVRNWARKDTTQKREEESTDDRAKRIFGNN